VSDRDGSTMGVDEYFQSDRSESFRPTDSQLEETLDDIGYGASKVSDADRTQAEQDLQPIQGGGALLEEPDATKLFRTIDRSVLRQERLARNREEARKHWNYVLGGCDFSVLDKDEDRSILQQSFPPGVDDAPQPIPNKVADCAKTIVSQVLVDPFLPDPKPDGANSDRNRGAADLTKKFLRTDGSPRGTNDQGMLQEVLSAGMTAASMFVWTWVDPTGGGWRPKQYKAHPRATDPRNPLSAPKLGPDGQPIMVPDGSGVPGAMKPITERTTDPVLRYVAEVPEVPPEPEAPEGLEDPANPDALSQGGAAPKPAGPKLVFTNNPAEAARQWMPKHRRRIMPPSMVRCHPPTADAFNARAITVLAWDTLDSAKDLFPILKTLERDELQQLCQWRPRRWQALVPDALRSRGGDILMDNGEISGDTLVFWYHHFCRISPDYPDGAEVAVTGASSKAVGFLLKRDTLREDVEIEDGTLVPVLMDPPIVQFKTCNDVKGGDPFGICPVSEFGGANELYAHVYVAILDVIDKGTHRNVFIPATSPVTREEMNRRNGEPISILVAEDKPIYEETPELPAFTPDLLDRIERGMNAAAGTNETSNGLDSEYAKSGVAKDISIRQAKVRLVQIWQNTACGIVQYWHVKTQQARARLTVPQEVMLAGTESAYKQRWFVGADLIGVREIPVATGTGTMMAPMEKLNLVAGMQSGQWLDNDAAGELARSTMSDDLGLAPDPHEEHIDRCIGQWIEGPPPGWEDQYAQNQQATQQYQTAIAQAVAALTSQLTAQGLDPASAQQAAQQQAQQQVPPPQLVPLETCFEPRPNDEEPGVAKIRARKLSNMMSTPDYSKQSPAWRTDVDTAYNAAFYASGGQTVRQKAEADAQAQQQAVKQQQEQAVAAQHGDAAKAQQVAAGEKDKAAAIQAKSEDAAAARGHQSNEAALDRQHQAAENAQERNARVAADVFKTVLAHRSKLASAQPLAQTA
jgi:hypothetical protein